MNRDEMTSRERLMEAVAHREPDRVPIVLTSREMSIRYSKLRFGDIWSDGSKYVEAQATLVKDFNLDAAWDIWCTPAVDEAIGARLDLPEDDPPWVPTPFLEEKEDIRKLNLNVNPEKDGRMPFLLSIVRGLKEKLGPNIPIVAWVSPPFRTACMLRGTTNLYLDMLLDPDFVKKLVEAVLRPCTEYGKALIEAGADIIATSNPVANYDCIRLPHYKEFSHPFTKRMFESLKEYGNVKILYHTCGNWDDRYDLVIDEGVDILHVDKVDIAFFKEKWGEMITIMGNVKSVETMLQGTPEQVEKESIACIEKASRGGGFILSADCTLPRDTSKENLEAMVKAGLTHGVYH
jgi:uroporphyrinogen decarboxylase